MAEEDFIGMDFAGYSPRSEEFEFHMTADDDPALLSPADELFYKGKLLPLHLPPRLQMVEQLLAKPPSADATDEGTAYRSCDASGAHSHSHSLPKKSWTKKLLNLKIKAPKSYLRSFFHKSRSSDEDLKTSNSMKRDQNEILADDERLTKSSVSSSAAAAAPTKSLSFSIAANSGGKSTLKRSSSVSSDAENSIQGAIAHCKKNQLEVDSAAARKSAGNVGLYLLSASKIAPDSEQDKKTEMMQFDYCF